MIGEGIHERVARPGRPTRRARSLVARINGGPDWDLSIRLGGSGACRVPVRSRHERLRTWASLTAVGRFAEGVASVDSV